VKETSAARRSTTTRRVEAPIRRRDPSAPIPAKETTMKTHRIERNREIDHSLAVGAKAFALGAVLVLVLAVTHAPSHVSGDPIAYPDIATANPAQPAPAKAAPATVGHDEANPAATLTIETPFTSTQADAVPLPPQF
jgi:hypothetical protein